MPAPDLPEQRDVALALVPETKVVAHHHVARAQPLAQDPVGEVLRAEVRQRLVEVERHQQVDAQGLDEPRLDPERRQTEGRRVRREEAARVRLEGEDRLRPFQLVGQTPGLRDHFLVAAVDAVEIADRDDRTLQRLRHVVVMAQDLHTSFAPRPLRGSPT